MINVVITDDHPFVRQGIRQILEDDHDKRFGVIEEAVNGSELLHLLKEHKFDVVVLDISLPGRSGLDLIQDIRGISPGTPVIMLSMFPEEQYALKALKSGASGYLTKSSAPEELITAIMTVTRGQRYITPAFATVMTLNMLDEKDKPVNELLSVRELEVVRLLASGKTVSTIAEELSLSPKTVSTYRERILAKLNLKTTSDIIRLAITQGLV
ncbi:MAG: response regulator transcription factor [Bacteroidales bacterium]